MFKGKLKKIIDVDKNVKNKPIEKLVFLAIVLIVTIIIINWIWNKEDSSEKVEIIKNDKKLALSENETEEKTLESKLENILSNISGVGETKVFLNYTSTDEIIPMYDESSKISGTEETDTEGGKRVISQTDNQREIIYQEEAGVKTPITKKVQNASIEGAIITAKGASKANIKNSIISAVEAVTGLATHKIQVFEMN